MALSFSRSLRILDAPQALSSQGIGSYGFFFSLSAASQAWRASILA